MSEVFDGYERQYCELSSSFSQRCNSISSLPKDQRSKVFEEMQKQLEEADSLIRRMDLEARSLPPTQKAAFLAKLREYKADLSNIKRDFKKASSDAAAERDELLESGGVELTAADDQRSKLLSTEAQLQESSDRLSSSRRVLLETEDLGVSILEDLHQQRQTLLHARDTLYGVDENISQSRQILNAMARRMQRNKWITAFVVVVLVLAIILVLSFRSRR